MGSVDLHFDSARGLFSVAAAVIVNDEDAPRIGQAEFFVDTGSNRTFIELEKALEMGLHLNGRSVEMTGGIAGVGGSPILRNVDLVLGSGGKVVHLDKVLVFRPPRVSRQKRSGPLVKTGTWEGEAVSLIGLDAIAALKGKVIVDLSDNPQGRIEWE